MDSYASHSQIYPQIPKSHPIPQSHGMDGAVKFGSIIDSGTHENPMDSETGQDTRMWGHMFKSETCENPMDSSIHLMNYRNFVRDVGLQMTDLDMA